MEKMLGLLAGGYLPPCEFLHDEVSRVPRSRYLEVLCEEGGGPWTSPVGSGGVRHGRPP